eukprot:scaffold23947_cov28-Tisochrysis_lutea.AAC.3
MRRGWRTGSGSGRISAQSACTVGETVGRSMGGRRPIVLHCQAGLRCDQERSERGVAQSLAHPEEEGLHTAIGFTQLLPLHLHLNARPVTRGPLIGRRGGGGRCFALCFH